MKQNIIYTMKERIISLKTWKTALILALILPALVLIGQETGIFAVVSTNCHAATSTNQWLECPAYPVPILICGPLSDCTQGDTAGSCNVQSCKAEIGGGAVYCGAPQSKSDCIYTHYEHDCAFSPFDHIAYTSVTNANGCTYVTAY